MSDFKTKAIRDALRKPFPAEEIGKLPATAKRPELDFVGHAAVTDRLNAHVPDWSYTVDELFSVGPVVWLRGTMTVGGISRVEYGDGDNPKEAIGNFIRRAAMRFGVAIDLWSRQELELSGKPDSNTGAETGKLQAGHREEGEVPGSGIAPSSHHFPLDPLECSHKLASGAWVPWSVYTDENGVGSIVCPKCGTSRIVAMEGTTADLGGA